MPGRIGIEAQAAADAALAVQQIVSASSDADFLDQLIEGIKIADQTDILHALDKLSNDRDADIELICTSNHQEFVTSVKRLDQGREDCTSIANEILSLVHSYQNSTENLATQKKNLVDSRNIRQNIDDSSNALKECLDLLQLANQVHDLVAKQNHYAALRALDELQHLLHSQNLSYFKVWDMIEKSIPATQKMIAEAVMDDLNTWLYRIRDISQYIGEVSFFHTEQRRARQRARAETNAFLGGCKLNSPLELVADESEEYDVLNDEEAQIHVDFTPLFECIHIREALGQSDRFRTEYAVTRRKQKELVIPSSLKLDTEDAAELKTLLESLAGFGIIEKSTMKRTENLRSSVDVDELWDSMCQSAITLMTSATANVDDAGMLLKIIGVVSIFIQTMESWKFHVGALTAFLLNLFEKYIQLLRKQNSDDFEEIVTTDDYLPMSIEDITAYDKIVDVSWYTPNVDRAELTFPVVLPFSQMYPMCCIDIRNFLNRIYTAPDDYLQSSGFVDGTIKNALDDLLCEQICKPLMERASLPLPPSQVVQIMTNLEHFERACKELQTELANARTARARSGPIVLSATAKFAEGRERAKDRIFELINSKIDDLIDNANYQWDTVDMVDQPSDFMTELTKWLNDTMGSALLGLPVDIRDSVYISSLRHATSQIMAFPLDASVTSITPPALHRYALDVSHFCAFGTALAQSISSPKSGNGLANATSSTLQQTVDELSQTVALMASDTPDEFYDIAQRNKKYASVDPQNGPLLLEKVERGKRDMADGRHNESSASPAAGKGNDRFGGVQGMMRGLRRGGEADKSSS